MEHEKKKYKKYPMEVRFGLCVGIVMGSVCYADGCKMAGEQANGNTTPMDIGVHLPINVFLTEYVKRERARKIDGKKATSR